MPTICATRCLNEALPEAVAIVHRENSVMSLEVRWHHPWMAIQGLATFNSSTFNSSTFNSSTFNSSTFNSSTFNSSTFNSSTSTSTSAMRLITFFCTLLSVSLVSANCKKCIVSDGDQYACLNDNNGSFPHISCSKKCT
ncbi:hypothetical protein CcaCcLH18_01560 [Colletotrichum camelliae]|nr:hypothetical protein CcaCcLH18_01560 [Colletotrichum camelliae]